MDRFASMETFVCVVEAGSFSAAARRLNVGQPAVSKSIAQLEDHLGVRLLLRSTRGLTPTEAGQHYYERAKRSIEEANEAELVARGAGKGLSGRLRVCGAVTFARLHVLPRLKTFLDAHPDLNIDIVLDDRQIDLLEHGIDVALRMGALNDSSMTARRLAQSRRFAVATPAYLKAHGEPKTPADLAQHQAVVYNPGGSQTAWNFRRGESEVSVAVSGRIQVSAAEGVRAVVLADMGIAIASEWMFVDEIRKGKVKTLLKGWELPTIDLWAVFPTGRMVSAKARAFADFVEGMLKESTT
ncbi:LysR family transcriptional regulator [Dyella nitratireducens]|uniref:LysR family transcriptional regulator n=1 Tax=Dyella nitratireducens TaxID=1849580 RepID=A0ABQ1FTN1_9GAMM|nr:LysR family transcriptional regulator [Dyella nitratireducens]GGA29985.1 LysR family transcriptional regulator [Dyella nitratireducens]GLQ43066.1 LysR family transcriptional regulator [Dyella nitratireducens]